MGEDLDLADPVAVVVSLQGYQMKLAVQVRSGSFSFGVDSCVRACLRVGACAPSSPV